MYRIEHTCDTHCEMRIALGHCAPAWKDNNNGDDGREKGNFDF